MASAVKHGNSKNVFVWQSIANGDTIEALEIQGPAGLAGCVQMEGSFGGDVSMEVSVDGTNFYGLTDIAANAITMSAAGLSEFATGAAWIRPSPGSGVTSTSVYVRFAR